MKTLILASALALGSFSMYAATPVITDNNNYCIEAVQDNFKEISTSDLPAAVTEAVSTDFSGATIAKAYVNQASEYKLILSVDGDSKTVYANATGEWIKK